MKFNIKTVLAFSLSVICFVNASPHQHSDQSDTKHIYKINNFDDTGATNSAFRNSNSPVYSQTGASSQILSKCLCVPYYRCDPGHWEKTEHDQCTRFMYVCCYGSEAVEFAMNQE